MAEELDPRVSASCAMPSLGMIRRRCCQSLLRGAFQLMCCHCMPRQAMTVTGSPKWLITRHRLRLSLKHNSRAERPVEELRTCHHFLERSVPRSGRQEDQCKKVRQVRSYPKWSWLAAILHDAHLFFLACQSHPLREVQAVVPRQDLTPHPHSVDDTRRGYRLAPLQCQLMPLQRIVLRARKSPKLGSGRGILALVKGREVVQVAPARHGRPL